jgi:hypothetical protein
MKKHAATHSQRRMTVFLFCGFCLCFILYGAVLIRFPNNFFADDSYFYFQIASNEAHHLGSTFNGIVPTNGYHPLWLLVCIMVFKLAPIKSTAIHLIAATIALLNLATGILLSRIAARTSNGLWWIPLLLYVPFAFLSQLGTEGSLSGLLVTAVVYLTLHLVSKPSLGCAFCYALAGSLAVLARLDNIFIIALMFGGVIFLSPAVLKHAIRWFLLLVAPVYGILWGTYIATNLTFFGTVQPISGILKSRQTAHGHINLPPHVALLALAIILPTVISRLWYRRDLFFRVVEAPFAVGVLIHALYILAVMRTGETRWTWYYTTWILLASLLLARTFSLLLLERGRQRKWWSITPDVWNLIGCCASAALVLAWFPLSYQKFGHAIPDSIAEGYEQNLVGRLHLKSVLAFDKPGRMAFFTEVQVVPLDGLMGDLHFQQELASKGVAAFASEHDIRAFVGPPQPLDAAMKSAVCDSVYLASTRFHCVPAGSGTWIVDSVEVFSRLQGVSAGSIDLNPSRLVWNQPGQVAVWLLSPPGDRRSR